MNHVYRLVWCESRKALIAVSELASAKCGKATSGGGRGGKSSRLLCAALIGATGLVCATGAYAQSTGDAKLDSLQTLIGKYDAPAPVRRTPDVVPAVPVVAAVVHQSGDAVASLVSAVATPRPAALPAAPVQRIAAPISSRASALGIADAGQGSFAPAARAVANPVAALPVVDTVVGTTSNLPVLGPVVGKVGGVVGTVTSGTGGAGGALEGVVGGVVGATSKLPVVGSVVGQVGQALIPGAPAGDGPGLAELGHTLGKVVGGVVNTAATLPVAGPTVASVGEALKKATSGGSSAGGLEGQAGQIVGGVVGTLSRVPGVGPVVAEVGALLKNTTADIGKSQQGAGGVSGVIDGVTGATSKLPVVGPVVGKVGDVLGSVTSGTGNAGGLVNGVVDGVTGATSKLPVVGPVVGKVGDVLASVTSGTGNAGGLLGGVVDGVVGTASQLPVVGPIVGQVGQALGPVTSVVGGLGQSSASPTGAGGPAARFAASPAAAGITPMAVPVVPPAGATPSGLIVGNGGVVGTVNQLLGTVENGLFNNSDPSGFVTSGGLQVSNANFSQGYSTLNLLGLPLLNTTPVGTLLTTTGGAVLGGTGNNSHLTLVGAVKSGNYISNINNGAAGGLLGLVLPGSAPAWASECVNVLGVLKESCWAVNAAQDRQVLMGDGASANGSNEVVIGTGASHTLPTVDACAAFPGAGRNDASDPCGVPTADYAARLGHSVVIGDGASGTANGQTVLGAGASASAANSVALGNKSVADRGGQAGYTAYGLTAPQNSAGEVSIGAPGQERQITNVAAGSADTDAVNVAQLRSVQSTADNSVQYDDPSKATVTLAGTASTDGGKTAGTSISNLHQGVLDSSSTDAVNGAQMWHWTQDTTNIYSNYSLYNSIKNLPGPGNTGIKYFSVNSTLGNSSATGENAIAIGPEATASGTGSVAVGNGAAASADDSVALGADSVTDRTSTVSVGSAGHERQIANVAAGTATTDAANVGQVQQAVNWANAYTDQRFSVFNEQLNRFGRNANAGIAGAMAMAGLPQAYLPGKSMAAVAAGTFRGESSLAIGISTISEGGRWVYKLTGSTNTRGDAGVTIGAGLQW